jgi:hypothetical protein
MSKHHDELDQQETAADAADVTAAQRNATIAENMLGTATSMPEIKAGIAAHNKAIHDLAEANGEDADDSASAYHKMLYAPDDATAEQLFAGTPAERQKTYQVEQQAIAKQKEKDAVDKQIALQSHWKDILGDKAKDRQVRMDKYRNDYYLATKRVATAQMNAATSRNNSNRLAAETEYRNAVGAVNMATKGWEKQRDIELKDAQSQMKELTSNLTDPETGAYVNPRVPEMINTLQAQIEDIKERPVPYESPQMPSFTGNSNISTVQNQQAAQSKPAPKGQSSGWVDIGGGIRVRRKS